MTLAHTRREAAAIALANLAPDLLPVFMARWIEDGAQPGELYRYEHNLGNGE
jgi:hypothetical protein